MAGPQPVAGMTVILPGDGTGKARLSGDGGAPNPERSR